MKQLLLITAFFITGTSLAQDMTNGGTYMDFFSAENKQLQADMWDYTRTISHGKSARKVEKRRRELIETSDAALKKSQSAKPFKENSEYRDAVIEYYRVINLVLKEDYAKLVDMEEVAEQSYDLMEAYMLARELASDKQTEASAQLSLAQKKFAEENNINLISSEDSMDKKMEIAGEVYDHYNEVYLIFFKSNKQEMYLLDAVGANDISAIEQNREALLGTVEEGLSKLKDVKPYSGDRAMIEATEALFKFYEDEASDGMETALDLIMKSENFTKIKTAFDEKKEKNRTQEDVDQYNNAVKEMNAAVEAYNAMNEANNKKRSKLIDAWNSTADKYTNTHVPRGK